MATVSLDTTGALAQALPDVLKGQGDRIIPVGATLNNINETYLPAGKQRLIAQTNEELMKGWLNPFTITN